MSSYADVVPEENRAIHALLYNIEVGLREFVIEALEAKCGSRWWKERLPGDVLQSYRDGLTYEQGIKWVHLVPHHPLYYIDFPDLKKIVERADNWKDVFQSVFGRKEVLVGTLSELEPIRNKVAHNRKATEADVQVTQAAYDKIVAGIGRERFLRLVANCTLADGVKETLRRLREEAEAGMRCCRECRPLASVETWQVVRQSWWFDPDYLGHPLDAIKTYFEALASYDQLPRTRGSGYKIEAWVIADDLEGKFVAAMRECSDLENG